MDKKYTAAVIGTSAAIIITTAMDANGLSTFSALPLLPLAALFWYLQRFSRAEMGVQRGSARGYGLALAYPLVVLGLAAVVAFAAGAMDVADTDWHKTLLNVGLISSIGVVMGLLTEEGFFRGWLWGALERSGRLAEAASAYQDAVESGHPHAELNLARVTSLLNRNQDGEVPESSSLRGPRSRSAARM